MQPFTSKAFNMAFGCNNAERLQKTRRICHASLKKQPDNAFALHLLGIVEFRFGHDSLACDLFEKAAALNPNSSELCFNYAKALVMLKKDSEAIVAFNRAIALNPDNAEAYHRVGNLYLRAGNEVKAAEAYQHALKVKPNYPEVYNSLGIIFRNKGEFQAAADCFDRALTIKPDYPAALNNLGTTRYLVGEFTESLNLFTKALALQPKYPDALNNLGIALRTVGQLNEAIAAFEHALALDRDKPELHKNLAIALLDAGRFEEGWSEYEWRLQTPQFASIVRTMTKPRWPGVETTNCTVLVRAEQGFGDMLQFCRYVPLLAARGINVILEVQPGLERLMTSLAGVGQIITAGQPFPNHDFYCPVMSLPAALASCCQTIPANVPYLAPPVDSVQHWRTRLPTGSDIIFKVGLCWAGNPRSNAIASETVDRRRSIDPALLAPLLDLASIQFYSLQKTGPVVFAELGIIDLMADCQDFADTAAFMANLDLIISVDTSIAHLAGALGKPVWLLNRFDSCWRWMRNSEKTPWYPTMRIFWQKQPRAWAKVVDCVKDELAVAVRSGP